MQNVCHRFIEGIGTMGRRKKHQLAAGTIFKRGNRYYFEWKPPEGELGTRICKSLDTSDEDEAYDLAKHEYAFLQRRTVEAREEALITQVSARREKARRAAGKKISLSDIMSEYEKVLVLSSGRRTRHTEADRTHPLAPRTLAATETNLGRFVAWLGEAHRDVSTMDEVTPAMAQEYFIGLRNEAKASTFNRHLADLRVVWKRLKVQAGLTENPFLAVEQRRRNEVEEEQRSKRKFSREELVVMQQQATGWIRPAMYIGYYTGLRLSDVSCLRWDDIDAEGFIKVRTRKTGREQLFYAPEVLEHLDQWRHESAALPVQTSRDVATVLGISTGSAHKLLNLPKAPAIVECPDLGDYYRRLWDAGKQANMRLGRKPPTAEPLVIRQAQGDETDDTSSYVFPELAAGYLGLSRKRDYTLATKRFQRFLTNTCKFATTDDEGNTVLGFHSLRVSHATHARNAGASTAEIQTQLGHTNGATTASYIQPDAADIRRELKANHRPLLLPLDTSPPPDPIAELRGLIGRLPPEQAERAGKLLAEVIETAE